MSRQREEWPAGREDLESRLFMELGALGIYPEVLELEEKTVRISDRSSSVRVRLDRISKGLESARKDSGQRFFIKDRPFVRQIRHLSWLGSRTKGPGKQAGVFR
jgi:hypothetical protein